MKLKNNQKKFLFASLVILCSGLLLSTNYRIMENHTESLPYKYVVLAKGIIPTKHGQVFAFKVYNNAHYHNEKPLNFIKIVGGISGDKITIKAEREVYVADRAIGFAKIHSKKGVPLNIIEESIIPEHKFFAYTPHKDSFDSRYQEIGLIDEKDIIGTAILTF